MEREKISYAIFVLNIIIFLISCSNEKINFVNIDNRSDHVIVLKNNYKVSNTSDIIGTGRMISNDNENFYFSNGFTRKIYHTNRPFTKTEIIGSSGKGPCEYSTPKYIKLFNKKLYFSDFNNNLIKNYPINGQLLEDSCYSFKALYGGQKFALNSRFLFVVNKRTPILSVFLRETKEEIKSLIKLSSDYNFPNSHFYGGGIGFDNNDNLYITMVAPLKIWKITLTGNKPVLKDEWTFKNLSGVDTVKIKELFVNNNTKKNFTNLTKIPLTLDMFIFGLKKQKIIIHQVMRSGEYKHYYYIISNEGKILNRLVSDKLNLIAAIDNMLFFLEQVNMDSVTDSLTIKEYEYNVKL